eukprot:scaffold30032_cov138-Isochrysis_galbana.AAC.10
MVTDMTTRSREHTAAMVQQSVSTGRLAVSHGATPEAGVTAKDSAGPGLTLAFISSLHTVLRACCRTIGRAGTARKVGEGKQMAPIPECTARRSRRLVRPRISAPRDARGRFRGEPLYSFFITLSRSIFRQDVIVYI